MAKKAPSKKTKQLKQLDETGRRKPDGRRKKEEPVAQDRRKSHRRRQIDPTTCEREYSDQEIEFMQAMDDYKRLSGRMFPTCSEILEVLSKLGYRQIADAEVVYDPNAETASDENTDVDADEEQLV